MNCMLLSAIAFVAAVIVLMIAAGYYMVRSYFREYTYDTPAKA
jgi:hypothetical protein